MINIPLLLTDSVIITTIFMVYVVGTLLWKPRLWLHDFPEDLQKLIPGKTQAEEQQTILLAIPFFIILLASFGIAALRYGNIQGFLGMFIHVYLLWQIVNLFDLVVIDWGGMHLIDPANPPFAGTEGAKGYRDYKFHFIAFLKGSVIGLGLVFVTTAVVWNLI